MKKYIINEPKGQYEDPRYDLLETGGLDNLASFISDRCEADISTQAVKIQLQALFQMMTSGRGPIRIDYATEAGFRKGAEEREKSVVGDDHTMWRAKLMDLPHDRTYQCTKKYDHLIVLKDWYDPERIKKSGKKVVGEDWLANEVADIMSHATTDPKILVHAGVLRRPKNEMTHELDYEPTEEYIQSAMGVVVLKRNPEWGLRYIRSTHVSSTDDTLKYNTRRRYHMETNNTEPYSVFIADHDETMMIAHHTRIGIKPELNLLPKHLRQEMLILHDEAPGYFGHQDSNSWEFYPQDFILDFDATREDMELAANCDFDENQIEIMKNHPSLRNKCYHIDIVENAQRDWREKVAQKNKSEGEIYGNITTDVLRRGTMIKKFEKRGFGDTIPPDDYSIISKLVPEIPKCVQLDSHVADSSSRLNRIKKRGRHEAEAKALGVNANGMNLNGKPPSKMKHHKSMPAFENQVEREEARKNKKKRTKH